MADIDAIDEDQKLISKILEWKRKNDLQGLIKATKEGRLVDYLAVDLANARRINNKGIARKRDKSLSCSPRSTVRDYIKLEHKVNSSLSFLPRSALMRTGLGGKKNKSSPAVLALLGKSQQSPRRQSTMSSPPLLSTPYRALMSPKGSSGTVLDYKTTSVLNFLMMERHNKTKTKRKFEKKVLDLPIEIIRHSAPELARTSATQTSLTIEDCIKPLERKSHGNVRPKTSYLTIVPEKPSSKSSEVNALKPSTKLIEKQKPIRRNFYGKQNLGAYKSLRVRSKSYSPKYEMKQSYPLEKIILEDAAMFESKGKNSDVPKLLTIKRKTMKLVKKAPGGNIFTLKKN
jgi:hypothetical protein